MFIITRGVNCSADLVVAQLAARLESATVLLVDDFHAPSLSG